MRLSKVVIIEIKSYYQRVERLFSISVTLSVVINNYSHVIIFSHLNNGSICTLQKIHFISWLSIHTHEIKFPIIAVLTMYNKGKNITKYISNMTLIIFK